MKQPDLLSNLRHRAGEFLTYNRTEQRGILVLGIILCAVILAGALVPTGTFREGPGQGAFEREVVLFETAWKRAADSDSMARVKKYHDRQFANPYAGRDSSQGGKVPSKPLLRLDLNAADTLDLQQLRGIGPGYARRIVQYRNRLGGYVDKRQLLEVFGMDSARYATIEPNLFVHPDSVVKIELNQVPFKELMRHPYFPFAAAKNIILYRQKNKMIRSVDELKEIPGVTDSLFRRMVRYIRL